LRTGAVGRKISLRPTLNRFPGAIQQYKIDDALIAIADHSTSKLDDRYGHGAAHRGRIPRFHQRGLDTVSRRAKAVVESNDFTRLDG
jgi:hypothetical protein